MPEVLFCSNPDFSICLYLVLSPGIKVSHYNLQFKYTDNKHKEIHHIAAKPVCYPSSFLLVGVLTVGLIIFSQVLTLTAAASTEMTDMELEDKSYQAGIRADRDRRN